MLEGGDKNRAHAHAITATAIHPEDPNAWALRAEAAEDPGEAIECLEKVLELDPQNAGARDRLLSMQLQSLRQQTIQGTDTHAQGTGEQLKERLAARVSRRGCLGATVVILLLCVVLGAGLFFLVRQPAENQVAEAKNDITATPIVFQLPATWTPSVTPIVLPTRIPTAVPTETATPTLRPTSRPVVKATAKPSPTPTVQRDFALGRAVEFTADCGKPWKIQGTVYSSPGGQRLGGITVRVWVAGQLQGMATTGSGGKAGFWEWNFNRGSDVSGQVAIVHPDGQLRSDQVSFHLSSQCEGTGAANQQTFDFVGIR